jgi:4-amino-4-deoxy-L-arabinose transferase-like glycosyltransferase
MAQHAAAATRPGAEGGAELAHALAGWGLVALGALLRIARALANRSLWGDEGSLAINVVLRSFAGLAGPLAHDQAAPLGFLWLEKAATLAFGESETALRLVPLLASLASLPLFRRLAREILGPRDALVALALFAISEPLVFYASEAKPYASDVLVALAIAWATLRVLRAGPSPGRLAALAAAGLAGPWLSLPAVFVCAGAWLALTGALAGRGEPRATRVAAAIGVLWLAGFALEYALLLRPLRTNALLLESWRGYFAPLPVSSEALAWWGRRFLGFFNDPLGLPADGLAAMLFAAGAIRLARRAAWETLLLLAPIGLVLAA